MTRSSKQWEGASIHPAAELLPRMSEAELQELADDIKKHGMTSPIVWWRDQSDKYWLLDGRNRLAALRIAGISHSEVGGRIPRATILDHTVDPYAYVCSANFKRRHLTAEQKRDLIAELLKATPDKSDRQIAEQTKTSPSTVGKVRKDLEDTGGVSKLDTRIDRGGRKQRAHKLAPATAQRPREPSIDLPEYAVFIREVLDFHIDFCARMRNWMQNQPDILIDERDALTSTYQDCAQMLVQLGGELPPGRKVSPNAATPAPTNKELSIPDFVRRKAKQEAAS